MEILIYVKHSQHTLELVARTHGNGWREGEEKQHHQYHQHETRAIEQKPTIQHTLKFVNIGKMENKNEPNTNKSSIRFTHA